MKAFAKTCELDSNNSKDVKTKIANPLKRDFDSVDEKSPGTSCSMAIGNCTEEGTVLENLSWGYWNFICMHVNYICLKWTVDTLGFNDEV